MNILRSVMRLFRRAQTSRSRGKDTGTLRDAVGTSDVVSVRVHAGAQHAGNYVVSSVGNEQGQPSYAIAESVTVATKPFNPNCFRFMFDVLDELYPQLDSGSSEDVDVAISNEVWTLIAKYKRPGNDGPVVYDSPIRRFAYLYYYAPTRASALHAIMGRYRDLAQLFGRDSVKVTCVGGGPGTDLVGIAKYIETSQTGAEVLATICDCQPGWSACWEAIASRLHTRPRVVARYELQDFTRSETWRGQNTHIDADFYTMVYCMAEFRGRQYVAEEYFADLLERARSGAYFLFLDVKYTDDYCWFDRLVRCHGLQGIPDNHGMVSGVCERLEIDYGEVSSANQGYRQKPWVRPRTSLKIAYRLYRKP
jgi:hypothetical protein